MANNGRVFVSHSHDDNARCAPLLTALDAWGVDYFFDTQGLTAGQQLNAEIQRELNQRDILLRVVTSTTQASFWMSLEASAFRGLQAEDQRRGRSRRVLINILLDPINNPDPLDAATLFIDAANRPRAQWLGDLSRAIGVTGATATRTLSRRQALTFGAASVVALGSVAAAGGVYEAYHPVSADAALPGQVALPGGHLWTLPSLSSMKDVPPVPSVYGSTMYAMTVDGLIAYDLSNVSANGPTKLWTKPYRVQAEFSSAVQADNIVYVTVDRSMDALQAKSGKPIWSKSIPTDSGYLASTPLIRGDKIFVLDDVGTLHACSAKDGRHLWRVGVDRTGLSDDLLVARSTPDGDDVALYIGSDDHHIYAFNQSDGSMRWKVLTRGPVGSSPSVVDGVVYIGSRDYYLYAIDAHSGAVKWKYLTGDAVDSSPVVKDGVVYFASNDSYLYTLDAKTGKPFWRAPVGDVDSFSGYISNGGPVVSQPAVTGDSVVVMDALYWVARSYSRSDGTSRWTYKPKDTIQNAAPIGAHGIIYIGSGDGSLYAYDA